jgi:hypothetical protein
MCRDRLYAMANPAERSTLLAVTAILAGLAHDPKGLLALFGGGEAVIESPVLDELVEFGLQRKLKLLEPEFTARAEREAQVARVATSQTSLVAVLEARFGVVPAEVRAALAGVTDLARLDALVRTAATCPDVAAFAAALA